jgi:hypothetical protein
LSGKRKSDKAVEVVIFIIFPPRSNEKIAHWAQLVSGYRLSHPVTSAMLGVNGAGAGN